MGLRSIIILCIGGAASAWVWFGLAPDSRSPASGMEARTPQQLVEEYQSRLIAAVESKSALNFSIARNPAQFSCLSSLSGACRGEGGNFQLYPLEDAAAQPLTQLVYGTGLRFDGTGCRSFPSPGCPIRLESRWAPVCAGAACDNVRTMRVELSVIFSDGESSFQTRDERLVQPTIELSESVRCQRDGGYYNGRQCVRGQAVERAVASAALSVVKDRNGVERAKEEMPGYPVDSRDYPIGCPEVIAIQGEEYLAELVEPGKARIRLPATNQCPDAHDTFIFSCVPIPTSQDPYARGDQGQWQQSQAMMAPPCGENGAPVGRPILQ